MVPSSFGRSNRGPLCRAYGLESKGRGQSKRGSQKAKAYKKGEEEEMVRVSPTTPR